MLSGVCECFWEIENEVFNLWTDLSGVPVFGLKTRCLMEVLKDIAATLSHDELVEVTKSSLCTIVSRDYLLNDLPLDIITEEILLLTAAEQGKCITIYISRENEPNLKVIIAQSATVRELKKSIARHFELSQQRLGIKVKISWKYIWKTYNLDFDGIILDDENSSIDNYGVCNKVKLTFKKKRKKNKKY